MRQHRYDDKLAYDWTPMGASGGDREVWVLNVRVHEGDGVVAHIAVLSDDEQTVRVSVGRTGATVLAQDEVHDLERRWDPDFDEVLEDPVVTLRRWTRRRYKPMTFLVPWDWEGQ